MNTNYNVITGNTCYNNAISGIKIMGDYNVISGNNCSSNTLNTILNGGGVYLDDGDYNNINGNICTGSINAGAGIGYGIYFKNTCNENTVMGNSALNNDTNFDDNGTNTFGDATLNNVA